jgi:hypothetical protein
MPATNGSPDRVRRRNLYVADLNTPRLRRLLRIENHTLTSPSVTTDGSTVAFRVESLAPSSDAPAEIGLFALDGRSQPRILTSALDRDVTSVTWAPDGWYLYTTAPSEGGRPLFRFTPSPRTRPTGLPRPQAQPCPRTGPHRGIRSRSTRPWFGPPRLNN